MSRPRLALAATVALVLTACSSAPAPSPEGPLPGAESLTGAGSPLDVAALERVVTDARAELLVPGVVVELHTPRGDLVRAFGSADVAGTVPLDPGDHVRVGSNTKTWVGTVVLQLVDEGRLSLDDPVSDFRDGVPNGGAITVDQLLSMRSGLPTYSDTLELNRALDQEPDRVWTPDELLDLAFARPPSFPPGQGYEYSNTNTVLLGLLVEQLEGAPLAQVLDERLFTPLGMADTLLPAATDASIPYPHPRGYAFGDNESTIESAVLPEDVQAAARSGALAPTDVTDVNPSWGWAAGAGISTAADLTTWVRALVGGGLLDPALQSARLASPVLSDPEDPTSAGYGQALARFGPLYGHTGELPGFNTFMGHDPVADVTLVVWTNLAPAVTGQDPATTIARRLLGPVYGG